MRNSPVTNPVVYAVIGIAILFFILTIRPGEEWGGDFSLYIAHAINIAEGNAYADTGFVFNPHEPFLSPRAYPPVYPAFLAPVYTLFGLDLHAMKLAGILVFAAFLVMFSRQAGPRLATPVMRVLLAAGIAFSPWYWEAKDHVLPELLFIFLLYMTILLMDRPGRAALTVRQGVPYALLVGLAAYLAYGTKSVGLALIPALVMSDIVRQRKLTWTTLIAAVLFTGLYFAHNAVLETDKSYLDSYKYLLEGAAQLVPESAPVDGTATPAAALSDTVRRLVASTLLTMEGNVRFYHQVVLSYWSGESLRVRNYAYVVSILLAAVGFIGLVLRNPSTADYLFMVYAAILLLVPFQQTHYLLPVLPLYLLYMLRGAEILAGTLAAGATATLATRLAAVIMAAALLHAYASFYLSADLQAFERNVETDESMALFDFIRNSTPEDSLVVFRKPRVLALYSDRRAVRYHAAVESPDLWNYLVSIGASYVVVSRGEMIMEDYTFTKWIDRNTARLEKVFENKHFEMFRLVSG